MPFYQPFLGQLCYFQLLEVLEYGAKIVELGYFLTDRDAIGHFNYKCDSLKDFFGGSRTVLEYGHILLQKEGTRVFLD